MIKITHGVGLQIDRRLTNPLHRIISHAIIELAMLEISKLKHLESECETVEDWTALALRAIKEANDQNYATELVGVAEEYCTYWLEFIELAQFVAEHLSDPDYVKKLLDLAIDCCEEATEYTELAEYVVGSVPDYSDYVEKKLLAQAEHYCDFSIEYAQYGCAIATLDNSDRGLAIIYKAVEVVDSDEKGEIASLSDYASQAGNKELAEVLSIEASSPFLDAWEILTLTKMMSSSNVEAAKCMANRAARSLQSVTDTVWFAKEFNEKFDDKDYVRKLLENVVIDCEDFQDYIQLVWGLADVRGEPEQIDDLLENAAQIASSGEEFVDLAYAWLQIKDDRGAALTIFRQAVPVSHNQTVLQNISKTASEVLNNSKLAFECYQRIVETTTAPSDLINLAVESSVTLGHSYYIEDLFDVIRAKMANANDLVTLAESAVQTLNNRNMVCKIYRDAITASDSFSELERILASQSAVLDDHELTRETLDRMKLLATNSTELLTAFTVARTSLQDFNICRSILNAAEDVAASTADLESVIAVVRNFAPNDQTWISSLNEKLESR